MCAMYRNRHSHSDACYWVTPWNIKSFQIDPHSISLSLSLSALSFPPSLCARYGVLLIISPLGPLALHASFLERRGFLLSDAQLSACEPVESSACWDMSSTFNDNCRHLRVATFANFSRRAPVRRRRDTRVHRKANDRWSLGLVYLCEGIAIMFKSGIIQST